MKEHSIKNKGKHYKPKEHNLKSHEPEEKIKGRSLWLQCLLIFVLFFVFTIALIKVDKACSKAIDSSGPFSLKKVEISRNLN